MRRLNPQGRDAPTSSGIVMSAPKTFRSNTRRAAYYPDDMHVYALDDGERPPSRLVSEMLPPSLPNAGLQLVVMFPTHACNLACRYCFERAQGRGLGVPNDMMTDRTVCRAIDLASRARSPRVSFFGGEPLIAWGKMRWAVERVEALCASRRTKPRLHVTTNGTLLDEERVRYLDEHGFTMIVSLDGPKHLHDDARTYPDGRGSYDDVMRGLEYIRARPSLAKRTSLRGTVMPGETPSDFVKRLEHVNDLCDARYAQGVSVEPATYCTASCGTAPGGWVRGDIMRLMQAGARWAVDRARKGKTVRWMHLTKTAGRLMSRDASWTECGATRGAVAVAPDGTIHSCHHEGFVVGNVRSGLDEEACAPWRDNRLCARERCAKCWARHLCGGGCRMEGWHESGIPESGPVSCAVGKARSVAAISVVADLADDPEALSMIVHGSGGCRG